jgi:hypothetical protein
MPSTVVPSILTSTQTLDLRFNDLSASDDLREFVHEDPSPRVDTFSHDRADLTMRFKVPGDKLIAFIQFVIGVSYVENSALRRKVPMMHPVHTHCFAKTVMIRGRGFDGDDTAAVLFAQQATPAKWKMYDAEVSFERPPYNVFKDEHVTAEYQRFVEKHPIPDTEIVELQGGQLLYDADTGDAWNNQPITESGLPGGRILARYESCGWKIIWHKVPLEWICQHEDTFPKKFMQVVGCVNDASFFGNDNETMLVRRPPKLHKYPQPVTTGALGRLYFACDIEFEMAWRDPEPKGKVSTITTGWNYALGPGLKYYYARTATTPARPLWRSRDFTKIFTIWSDTFAALT